MATKRSIGTKLSILSDHLGISQTELSDRVGVTPGTINRFFNDKRDVHASVLVSVLKELGIDIESLVQNKLKALNEIEMNPQNANEAINFLFNSLDDLGKQAFLANLLWVAKQQNKTNLPKKVIDIVKNELSHI